MSTHIYVKKEGEIKHVKVRAEKGSIALETVKSLFPLASNLKCVSDEGDEEVHEFCTIVDGIITLIPEVDHYLVHTNAPSNIYNLIRFFCDYEIFGQKLIILFVFRVVN